MFRVLLLIAMLPVTVLGAMLVPLCADDSRTAVAGVQIATARETVLPSIVLHNGNRACSGTIFSVGPEWAAGMSAGHCFDGHIGGKFRVSFPDGTSTDAILMVHRPEHDVAIWRVPTASVIANAPLPSKMPAEVSQYESVGFPGGKGPYYQKCTTNGNNVARSQNGFSNRWTFTVADRARDGHSGSGVFADGKLVCVVSEVDYSDGKTIFGCPHGTLVKIIQEDCKKIGWCGKLLDDDEYTTDREVNVEAAKNAQYFEYECGPNGCRLKRKAQSPAPPPRGQSAENPPWLQPNVDVTGDGETTRIMPRQHADQSRPKTPRQRSDRIVGDEKRLDAIEDALDGVVSCKPEKGEPGRDGVSPPPIITTIVKDVGIGAFLLTALVVPQMLFGGIVFGVLLVSFVIRAGLAYFQAE